MKLSGVEEPTNPGDWKWSIDNRAVIYMCPCGCGRVSSVLVNSEPGMKAGWDWDGNLDAPTLSPSIQHIGACRWHGYLTLGQFVEHR
jgi:hypothetical protein